MPTPRENIERLFIAFAVASVAINAWFIEQKSADITKSMDRLSDAIATLSSKQAVLNDRSDQYTARFLTVEKRLENLERNRNHGR